MVWPLSAAFGNPLWGLGIY